jgi:hypothetical protein
LDGGRNTDEVLQGSRKFKVETYIQGVSEKVGALLGVNSPAQK